MTKEEKAKALAKYKAEQLNIDNLISFYFNQKVEEYLNYSEEYLDDKLQVIENKKVVENALEHLNALLAIINKDKDGSYFICEENKRFLDFLYKTYYL